MDHERYERLINERLIYEQDCKFYRFQDQLRWSRFKTISVIEGAMLYTVFIAEIGHFERFCLFFLGSVLVAIVSRLAHIDEDFAKFHLERIKIFQGEDSDPQKVSGIFTGANLMLIGTIFISLFNLVAIICLACQFVCCTGCRGHITP